MKDEKRTRYHCRSRIEKLLRRLLIEIGENPEREGLIGTPARMAEMYEELFSGYRMNAEIDVSFSETTDVTIAKRHRILQYVRTSYASIFWKNTHSLYS